MTADRKAALMLAAVLDNIQTASRRRRELRADLAAIERYLTDARAEARRQLAARQRRPRLETEGA